MHMSSVPRLWRLMWGLHALESERIMVRPGGCGLERAATEAFHKQYGRSVDEIVADHDKYTERIEAERTAIAVVMVLAEKQLVE